MKFANHYTFFWFYQFTQTLWERIPYILLLENFKNTKLHERTRTALFSSMNQILHSAAHPYWSAAVREAVLETDLDRTDRKDSISMLQRWEKRWNEEINLPQKNNATTLISCATKTLQKITIHLFCCENWRRKSRKLEINLFSKPAYMYSPWHGTTTKTRRHKHTHTHTHTKAKTGSTRNRFQQECQERLQYQCSKAGRRRETRRSTCQKNFAATLIPCETRTLQKITIHMFQLWESEEKMKAVGVQAVL